jgi:hypothetical protein
VKPDLPDLLVVRMVHLGYSNWGENQKRTLAELRENPSSIRVDAVLGFNFYKP